MEEEGCESERFKFYRYAKRNRQSHRIEKADTPENVGKKGLPLWLFKKSIVVSKSKLKLKL